MTFKVIATENHVLIFNCGVNNCQQVSNVKNPMVRRRSKRSGEIMVGIRSLRCGTNETSIFAAASMPLGQSQLQLL